MASFRGKPGDHGTMVGGEVVEKFRRRGDVQGVACLNAWTHVDGGFASMSI